MLCFNIYPEKIKITLDFSDIVWLCFVARKIAIAKGMEVPIWQR